MATFRREQLGARQSRRDGGLEFHRHAELGASQASACETRPARHDGAEECEVLNLFARVDAAKDRLHSANSIGPEDETWLSDVNWTILVRPAAGIDPHPLSFFWSYAWEHLTWG